MAEYYNQKSLLSGINAPQFDIAGLGRATKQIQDSLSGTYDKEIEDEKLRRAREQQEYQRSRDALSDARYDKQELRKDKEQQATDAFYDSMAAGPKQVAGLYGDVLSKNASPYELTQAEIASGIIDPIKARASGNESLAKKLEWQLDAGETANKAVTADAFKESRPEMYLRMMDENRSKGLPVLPGMVEKYESAKLAEETANAKKLEDITKLKEDIYKDQLSNQWKLVGTVPGKNGEVQVGVDSDGNPTYMPTLKEQVRDSEKAQKDFDKEVADATTKIVSVFDEAKGPDGKRITLDKDSKAPIISALADQYVIARKNFPNLKSDTIADIVKSTAGTKSGGYIWGDPTAKFNQQELNDKLKVADDIERKLSALNPQQVQISGTDGQNMPSKFDMAKELVSGTNAINANRLSGVNSKMAQLNMTPEERRITKAQEWLRSKGLGSQESGTSDGATNRFANINKELTDPKKSIAGVPDSLRVSEGIVNKAYGDSGGYAVGMGYNLTQNKDEIFKDFEDAGISRDKALLGRTNPKDLVLTDDEAQRLAQVGTFKYIDRVDNMLKGSGKTFDTLSPAMQPIALQMMYRGDLLNDAAYSKDLKRLVKNDDVDSLVNYVATNSDKLPKEVVTRLQNNLKYDSNQPLRGTMTDSQKNSYLDLKTSSDTSKPSDKIEKLISNSGVQKLEQNAGSLTDEQIALSKPVPNLTIEPEKQKTGFQILGTGAKSGINETYKQATGALRDLVMPAVQGVENIFGSNKTAKAGLALANNTAAGMNEILFSPYTVTKAGTDWLLTGKAEKGIFTKQAEDARELAISALREAGVENPTSQEILMIMSDTLAPIAGAGKAVSSGIKTGARELNNLPNASDLEFLVSKSNRLPAPLTQGVPNVSSKTDVALGSEISKKLEGLNVKPSEQVSGTYVNKSTPDYFTNIKNELDAKDTIIQRTNRINQQNVVESAITNAAQDFKNGKISEQEFRKFLKDTNDSGLINTRQMLEKIESIIGK